MFALMIFVVGLSVGRTPAIIALVLYSLLVLIRNVVTGLDSVPPETKDAARGMGALPTGRYSGGSSCRWRCR
jgi:ABC-type proline/glycine betaine transport systems, permease component